MPPPSEVPNQSVAATNEGTKEFDEKSRISEFIFHIDNFEDRDRDIPIVSSRKTVELFRYGICICQDSGFEATVVRFSLNGVSSRVIYNDVEYEITLINQRDKRRSITMKGFESFIPDIAIGLFSFFDEPLQQKKHGDFFDEKGGIELRAKVNLNGSTVTIGSEFPFEEYVEETRVEKVCEFEKGEEIRYMPAWSGNYRTQIAVYPGGHPDHSDGEEYLAMYVHLLGIKEGAPKDVPLKLSVKIVNQLDYEGSKEWEGTFVPSGAKDESWGCHKLLSISRLRNKDYGWLQDDGSLVLKVSVKAADEGSNPRQLVDKNASNDKRNRLASVGLPQEPSKRFKVDC